MKDIVNQLKLKELGRLNESSKDLILNYHYAKRLPSVSYSFGAFIDNELVGVVTFGKPASPVLCNGVCGKEYSHMVYELNRLVFKYEIKNGPSKLVGFALKQLKKQNLIIVSYADNNMSHNGYIYQATNFLYTGLSAKRTDTYSPKGVHSRHVARDTTSDTSHLRILRSRKHRYVYFATNKKLKTELLNNLKYSITEYPKGENKKYILGEEYNGRWIKNNKTGEVYYES